MWINVALLLIIFFLIYLLNKKKLKNLLLHNKIKICKIENVDNAFLPLIKKNLLAPKDDAIINFFCIPSNFNVVGMTSDYEAWILGVLAKKSNRIFEFGTCSGKTTLIFSMNSPQHARIDTITLDEETARKLSSTNKDNKIAKRNIINESKYDEFMFSKTIYENKIKVIFQDSTQLDISNMKKKYDLIFIDGGHTYSCIKNDTEKSLEMIKENGIILWHDFSVGKRSHKDVFKYLNEISHDHQIRHIENTTLCYLRK